MLLSKNETEAQTCFDVQQTHRTVTLIRSDTYYTAIDMEVRNSLYRLINVKGDNNSREEESCRSAMKRHSIESVGRRQVNVLYAVCE